METVKVLPNGTELNVMYCAACKDIDYNEDVEIVIKMPRYAYDDLIKNRNRFSGSRIYDVILDGTVLPKGHGRLIDADEIQFENAEFDTYGDYSRAFDAIDQADTVIEADKGESE